MKTPTAIFSGLALIAAAIFFGLGSSQADAQNKEKVQKIAFCDENGRHCIATSRINLFLRFTSPKKK